MDKNTLKEILAIGRVTTAIVIIVPTLLLVSLYGLCSIIASERGISFLEVFNDLKVVAIITLPIVGVVIIAVLVIALYENITESFIEKELK